jgi:hypothetical protein
MYLLQCDGIDFFSTTTDVIHWVIPNHPDAIPFWLHFFQRYFEWGFVWFIETSLFTRNNVVKVVIKPEVNNLSKLNLCRQIRHDCCRYSQQANVIQQLLHTVKQDRIAQKSHLYSVILLISTQSSQLECAGCQFARLEI